MIIYVSYIYFNQAEMVFLASKLPKDYKFEFNQNFEEYNISSYDGKKQNGLLFKTVNSKGIIFYLHGNAGSLDSWGNNAKIYTDLGYDIFFLDYRGFGKSEGEIKNQGQIFRDINIVYDKITSTYKNKQKVIIGYSIGTGLATYLASLKNPDKLILQAPFYNFLEFTEGTVPYFPDFLKKFQFETNKYIVEIKAQIYIFHGNQDKLIHHNNSERLKKIIKTTDSLFILENQSHVGINENFDFQNQLKIILKN
ncbi:MAG: alpha/beta fold hydrolase [Flavobacterium sp.]|uniref:alpha/beta hydrolase n=1 Tax=Flavobacterium sp. TaxID=239 RepID=UPI0022BD9F82|nr:alpha/beta fold hydrolase [Flavobacterium sp.]MCZ8330369.1 alpha/beta fold hydrolase [Flavobacterium sp.]